MLAPLHALLHHGRRWAWSAEESEAFRNAKSAMMNSTVLAHFDPGKELVLSCDASPYGIGVVLSHRDKDGVEKPIAFGSRTLTKAEKNYSHLEKEALALVFGVTKFRDYLLGRKFILITDHRPLVSIFSENKCIPAVAAARIQRWALTLAAFDYCIQYREGSKHGNADALSRLPIPTVMEESPKPPELVLLTNRLDDGPVTSHQIRCETAEDSTLSLVLNYTVQGWPKSIPEGLRAYFKKRDELSTDEGILLWGNRVIIPTKLRPPLL